MIVIFEKTSMAVKNRTAWFKKGGGKHPENWNKVKILHNFFFQKEPIYKNIEKAVNKRSEVVGGMPERCMQKSSKIYIYNIL